MKTISTHLYLVCTLILLFSFSACQKKNSSNEKPYKVIIINSYFRESEYSVKAKELYEQDFQKEGLPVSINYLYADMPHSSRANLMQDALSSFIDTLTENPDLMIINDDDMFHVAMTDSAFISRFPVVFGGVNYLSEYHPEKYKNVTGFIDTPNIKENLRLIKELTGTQLIDVVLDVRADDDLRKESLQNAIQELGMIDDSKTKKINQQPILHFPDSTHTYVVTLSASHPEMNVPDSTSIDRSVVMENAYNNAKYAKHLQLEWSTTSNTFIDRSKSPQFTAINELFGDSKTRFLGGYFTSLETQIADEVRYAAEILRGKSVALLPIKEHQKGYYMDYNAMVQLHWNYDTYKDKFQIINAPYQVRHSVLYIFIILGILLLSLLILGLFILGIVRLMNRKRKKMLQEMRESSRMRELALGQSKTTLWQYKNHEVLQLGSTLKATYENFMNLIHPDDRALMDRIFSMQESNGKHVARVRFRFSNQTDFQWYELIYNLTDKNKSGQHLEGISMNINQLKKNEELILQANENQELVNIKETIMANMSHDIRTPLGAVVGFADIMVAEGEMLSKEERLEYAEIIRQNSQMLETMISDILDEKSEVGVFKFHLEDVNVSELIHKVWLNNKVLCPKHLILRERQEDLPELKLKMDANRMQEVLNNFLSNAFKFTPEGSIVVGWHQSDKEVELYVQDTGVGIAEKDLDTVFERYYKTAESHKGTGMGLNICKTIVEQLGGRIAVTSELGKGSRFSAFFKNTITALIILFTICSCGPSMQTKPDGKPYKVTLIHTYDTLLDSYRRFNKVTLDEFQKAGYQVDLMVHYLDIYKGEPNNPRAIQVMKEIKEEKPEVILMDDDLGSMSLYQLKDPFLRKTPTILGNMHIPEKGDSLSIQSLTKDAQVAVWRSPIDFAENIRVAAEITENNLVEIELDYEIGEEATRKELRKSIATPEFLDNSEFIDNYLDYSSLHGRLKDKIVVCVYSLKEANRNVGIADSLNPNYGKDRTEGMLEYSRYYPSLVIKKDLYANGIALSTEIPQFTTVNVDFNNSTHDYVGGYFCPMEDVAKDMVSYAVKIFQGKDINSLPIGIHQQKHVLDWLALQKRNDYTPLYEELSKKYQIFNVPFKIAHSKIYLILWIIAGIILLLCMGIIIYYLNKKLQSKNEKIREQLEYDREYGNLVFLGVMSCTFHYDEKTGLHTGLGNINNLQLPQGIDAFDKIEPLIEPGYSDLLSEVRQSINKVGDYNYILPITLNKEHSYRWIQLRYKVTTVGNSLEANGLIIDANETMAREQQLKEAQKKAEATQLKDQFLKDLRNQISAPLDQIVKYSEELSSPSSTRNSEENLQTVKKLDAQGQKLMDIVNKTLELVRMESGRVKLEMKSIALQNFYQELESRWKEKLSVDIHLNIYPVDSELAVQADELRLNQMLDILIERSVNHLQGKAGSIYIETFVEEENKQVEITIKDTGKPIEEELVKLTQKRFEEQKNFDLNMGLNLNIVNAISWNMNGKLTTQSLNSGNILSIFLKKALTLLLLLLVVSSCGKVNTSSLNTEKEIVQKDWNRPICHSNSDAQPLQPSEFVPNFSNTITPEIREILENMLQNMVYVEGGSFLMGDSIENPEAWNYSKPCFEEKVENFYIGRYEVTQKEWKAVMGHCSAYYADPDRPIENISWVEGNIFMDRLSTLTGLPFRYPTEEEWEYAAQGGQLSNHTQYAGSNDNEEVAFFKYSMENEPIWHTMPVGKLKPNELKIYDMSGNVWEFTSNDWREDYCTSPDNSWRTIRGGSFRSGPNEVRTTSRTKIRADWKASNIGFRLAL